MKSRLLGNVSKTDLKSFFSFEKTYPNQDSQQDSGKDKAKKSKERRK